MADGVTHPHAHHRERLRERYLRAGLTDFAPHNVLELLLFYPILRRDTNPTAHALLSHFGTVDAVLHADAAALTAVAGVGAGVAEFMTSLAAVSDLVLRGMTRRTRLGDADLLGTYFCELLGSEEGERGAVLFLDNNLGVIGHRIFDGISIHSPRFSLNSILEDAFLFRASSCAVAHLHRDGLALPSAEDLDLTRTLRNTMDAAGIRLIEHFIVGGGRYACLLQRHSGVAKHGAPSKGCPRNDGEAAAFLGRLFAAAHIRADAETLLSAYGGLYPLLSASVARHRYEGLDARTSALLSLVLACHTYCVRERPVPSPEGEEMRRYLAEYYRAEAVESVLLFLFDGDGRHLATRTVGHGSVAEAAISCRHMAEDAFFLGASSAVLAHNHPQGVAVPSQEDHAATEAVSCTLAGIGVTLLSHYIVAGDDVLPVW